MSLTGVRLAVGGCETVQKSAYSEIGGLPLPVLGLAADVALVVATVKRGELAAIASFALGLLLVGLTVLRLRLEPQHLLR